MTNSTGNHTYLCDIKTFLHLEVYYRQVGRARDELLIDYQFLKHI